MCFKRAIKTYVRKSHRRLDASKSAVGSPALLREKRGHRHCAILLGADRAPVARRQVS